MGERALYINEMETEDSNRIKQEALFFNPLKERTFVIDDFYSVINWDYPEEDGRELL